MNYRPYPDRDKALAQLERQPVTPVCPLCTHPLRSHAVADGIATCGPAGRPDSCLACVKAFRAMPALRAFAEISRALTHAPGLVVLTGRQSGRTAVLRQIEADALARHVHVHRASVAEGVVCLSHVPGCHAPRFDVPPQTAPDQEATDQ